MAPVINARFLTQNISGVQRFAIELAKELKRINPAIIFVSPYNIIHKELAEELGVIVVGLNKSVLWEQIDLPLYLLRNGSPLLINLCNVAPILYNNQIITIHDMAFFINPTWFRKKFTRYYTFVIPIISKRAKLVFTVSNFSKQEIIKYLSILPEKIKVIYNGTSELADSNNSYPITEKYILVVGSVNPRKNISRLINAFNSIPDKDYKLIVAGDNSSVFNNKDSRITTTTEDIIFMGRIDDQTLASLYKKAILFIYPSLYEGFGIPPLEAMSYDCPTLVSDIGSLREVCADASAYVNPVDTDGIANKITELIQDKDKRLDLVAKGAINIKRFSWNSSARKVAESIDALTN